MCARVENLKIALKNQDFRSAASGRPWPSRHLNIHVLQSAAAKRRFLELSSKPFEPDPGTGVGKLE
jgi:hypothetical protein